MSHPEQKGRWDLQKDESDVEEEPIVDARHPVRRAGFTIVDGHGEGAMMYTAGAPADDTEGASMAENDPRVDERSDTGTVTDGHTDKRDTPGTVERE